MIASVLKSKSYPALLEFLHHCKMIKGVDIRLVHDVAVTTIKYLNGNDLTRKKMRVNQELEKRWYKSLADNSPDWSVYDTDLYLAELWACWTVYSKQYLIKIQSPKSLNGTSVIVDMGEIKTIVDLGCGFGYTAVAFKELFPQAHVIGTNFKDILQTNLAEKFGRQYGFDMVYDIHQISNSIDLIFASEYFEHIQNPIDHLHDIIKTLHPKYLLIANSFNAVSVGHFPFYQINGRFVNGKEMSSLFNDELRQLGYEKIKTNLWNNRPSYWKQL